MIDISLALGGGGVKGVAHIGVIRCLEEQGFRIRAVAGTSAGSLVGALYAAGVTPLEIEEIITRVDQNRMFGRLPSDGPSLMGLAGISKALTEVIGKTSFDELKIPFACTAVDAHTAREVIMRQGRVLEAVLASSAVPGVFPAVHYGEWLLIDGGVLDPVPVNLARWLAPELPVVAVVLSPAPDHWAEVPAIHIPHPGSIPAPIIEQLARLRIAQAFQIFVQSVDITSRMLTELRLEIDQPEVIIRPEVGKYGILEPVDVHELIRVGEAAAQQAYPQIRKTMGWANQMSRRLRRVSPPGVLAAARV